MKALNFIIALLLCTQAYGQDFDLKDLLAINSEETFKRFCAENGYAQLGKDEGVLSYSYEVKSAVDGTLVINYAYWYLEYKAWALNFTKRNNKRPHPTFKKIFTQAKRDCEYSGFSSFDEITYSCPDSENSSRLGFEQLPYNLRDNIVLITPDVVKVRATRGR